MSNISVSSTATLTSALHSAQSGDTILLQTGTYTGLDYVFNNLTFAQGITITSADIANPATLTHFDMQNASGITFSNLAMVTQATGYFDFQVFNSNNIHFDHVSVHGSLDGNPQNDIEGIRFEGSSNISITNSEFQQLIRAMAVGSGNNILIANNNVHDVEVTGVSFAQVGNVTVNGNMFSNFHTAVGDHPDAIQFLTSGTTVASHDITITNNAIYRGTGDAAQGIFLRDQLTTLNYQNVTIANNLIDGTGYGGIAVDYARNISVTGNVLISNVGANNTTPLQIFDSSGVTLTNNQAISISTAGSTAVSQSGNVINSAVTDGGAAALQAFLATHTVGIQGGAAAAAVVNVAPTGADATSALAWNATKVFATSDFGFADANGNHLSAVKIDTLPSVGSLTNNGLAVTAGQSVTASDIAAGRLIYRAPATAGAAHVDITFQVKDDGGVANGGVDTDPTANTYHIDVAAQLVSPPPPPTGGQSGAATPAPTVIQGSIFNEHLAATNAATEVHGGDGNDTITGNSTSDYLRGDGGDDSIQGGSGFDDINGNAGNDTIDGGTGGNDWLLGGQGNDQITAHNGSNLLFGNLGNDTLIGGAGNDTIRGGKGDDSIVAGSGSQWISGDLGNDTIQAGSGADTFHSFAQAGIDKVLGFSQAKGDHVQLDAGTTYTVGQVGADTVIDMGGGNQLILSGVQMSSLHDGWLLVG